MVGPFCAPSNANVAALLLVSITRNSTAPTVLSQPHLQRPPKSHFRYLKIISAPAQCTTVAGWSMTATKKHFNLDKIACKLSAKLAHQPKHLQRRHGVSKHCACCLRRQCLYATKSKVSDHKSAQGSKAISRHYRACLIWSMYA